MRQSARIAVVGIGCRLPGSIDGPESYWRFLMEKGSGICEVPADRWSLEAIHSDEPNAIAKTYSKWGGFLDDIRAFDPAFFDISPREAALMDPQQRLLLQVAYEAIQDAGTTLEHIRALKAGVFVGISTSDYGNLLRYKRSLNEIWAGTGAAFSVAANRISHRLNLNGPSLAIDTACSSALVAIDTACRHLFDGTCEVALAGGVNALIDPAAFIAFSNAGMLSRTGAISTFDVKANGFVRGEGSGLVLLKRLEKAEADGDRIYAVIRATTVNQDGHTSTLTAPSDTAQIAMLEALLEAADVSADDIGYVEAHGTGTPIGDPIEARAIGRAIGQKRKAGAVLTGSVKPNIGHLESASGIAGFIKAVLAVRNGAVPPNCNFDTPSPAIPMDALNIRVPVSAETFPCSTSASRMAVVNSFGFGGTNASALVESYTQGAAAHVLETKHLEDSLIPVPISAADEPALRRVAKQLADALTVEPSLATVSTNVLAATLAETRDHLNERAVLLCRDRDELAAQLALLQLGEDPTPADKRAVPTIIRGRAAADRRVAFTYAGQGGQWYGMARRLLTEDKVYRHVVEEFDELFRAISGWSVVEAMLASEENSRVDEADVTQPAIFANQIGLTELWRCRGVNPDVVIGHSFGEVAATYTAGIIDLPTAAKLIHRRGLIRFEIGSQGAMAAIGLDAGQLAAFMPSDGSVAIAAYNGPTMLTISGTKEGVDGVVERASAADPNTLVRMLKMDFGWHGFQLDPGEAWFKTEMADMPAGKAPRIPVISTVTGRLHTEFDADYWWLNLRLPVAYQSTIEFALRLGYNTFLELGPHRTLTPLTTGIAVNEGVRISAPFSLHRDQDDYDSMTVATATLHCAGVRVGWREEIGASPDRSLRLPKYPWAKTALWQSSEEAEHHLFEGDVHPLLGKRAQAAEPRWTNEINLSAFRYLGDHGVEGKCVFPAAGYIEMMAVAAQDHFGSGVVELTDVRFLDALSIDPEDGILLETVIDPDRRIARIFSRTRGDSSGWRMRADCTVLVRSFAELGARFSRAITRRKPSIKRDAFYELTNRHRLTYGPTFQGVEACWDADGRYVARIETPEDIRTDRYLAHPAILDACFQSPIPRLDRTRGGWTPGKPLPEADDPGVAYPLMLPIGIRRVVIAGRLPHACFVEFVLDDAETEDQKATYVIHDQAGRVVARVEDFEMRELDSGTKSGDADLQGARFYREAFYPVMLQGDTRAAGEHGRWLSIGPLDGMLADAMRRSGAEIVPVRLDDPAALDPSAILRELDAISDVPVTGLIFSAEPSALGDGASDKALLQDVEREVFSLITIARALDQRRDYASRLNLRILTRSARQETAGAPTSVGGLVQSPLVGLSRSIASECPDVTVRLIDCDAAALRHPDRLASLLTGDPESEILMRGNRVLGARIEQVEDSALAPRHFVLDRNMDPRNFTVTMSRPGAIDNIVLRESERPKPAEGEVLVEVEAVGLNFRDIMAATSILPDELEGGSAWWRNLGLEFSGTVVELGAGVTGRSLGERVMGMGKGYLRRFAVVPHQGVMTVPDAISAADAASIPAAFMTAHYALVDVARLRRGERVLIHLASGGVGLAAIEVARQIGAEIFATAGSDVKRQFLRDLGVRHVMDSRTLDFADEVMAATGRMGVDVVLNALSGSGIDKGLECLAPFGRFVEIGKRDVFANKPLGLMAIARNCSFSVIDLSEMGRLRPDTLMELLAAVAERIADGRYKPIAVTSFPVSDVRSAFTHLAKARHIGKVVVDLTEPTLEIEAKAREEYRFDRAATYLVTGGLSGFGTAVADWMSANGAGRLVLASRRGVPDADVAKLIKGMEARGTEVMPVALDVQNGRGVRRLVDEIGGGDKPLKGIVHGAAVILDGFIGQLSREQIENVLRPKVGGAWNLYRAVRASGADLDFFVSFSSLAQFIGSAGQANYTSANAFLDAFAFYGRSRGIPASTIDWGALGETGFVARNEAMISYLESVGMKMMSDAEAARGLAALLNSAEPSVAFAAADWKRISRAAGHTDAPPRLRGLLSDEGKATRVRAELAAAEKEGWPAILETFIRVEIAKVLKVDAEAIPADRPLMEIGLDSLSSFELKNRIEAELAVPIPVGKFLQAPTVAGLSKLVAAVLEADIAASRAAEIAEAAGEDDSRSGPSVKWQPFTRQQAALSLASAPMTSDHARKHLIHTAIRRVRTEIDDRSLDAALAALASEQDAVGLVAVANADGLGLAFGRPPTLMRVGSLDETGDPGLQEGSLWQFAVTGKGRARVLHVRCHAAAGDFVSVHKAADRLLALAGGAAAVPGKPFAEYAKARERLEGMEATIRDQAFWHEFLNDVGPKVRFPSRRRASVPVGFGAGTGSKEVLERRLEADAAAQVSEARLCWAFANAVEERMGEPVPVIARHALLRGTEEAAELLGPVADCVYVPAPGQPDEVARRLAMALEHRDFDAEDCKAMLQDMLVRRDCDPDQFGFSSVDLSANKSKEVSDRITETVASHCDEMHLLAIRDGKDLRLLLSYDVDVVDAASASAILDTIATSVGSADTTRAQPALSGARHTATVSRVPRPRFAPTSTIEVPSAKLTPSPSGRARAKPATRPVLSRNLVPVTQQQAFCLGVLSHPDVTENCSRHWTAKRAIRIRPSIDVVRMRMAVTAVAERHESLRLRFLAGKDGWQGEILRKPRGAFDVMDLGEVSEAELLRHFALLDAPPRDLAEDAIFKVTILRCGKDGDIIHTRGHHLILDGASMAVVLGEVFQIYVGMADAGRARISLRDYLRLYDGSGDRARMNEREAHFREVLLPPVPSPMIGRQAKGLALNMSYANVQPSKEISATVDAAAAGRLTERVRSSGVTQTSVLLAAFARTVAERSGASTVYLPLYLSGRNDNRVRDFVGRVASAVLIRCDADNAASIDDVARGVHRQIQDAQSRTPADNTVYNGRIGQEFRVAGLHPFQFFTGMLVPDSVTQSTPISALLIGGKAEISLGGITVNSIPGYGTSGGTAAELDIRSIPTEAGFAIRTAYDVTAFDDGEAEAITHDVLRHMGVEDLLVAKADVGSASDVPVRSRKQRKQPRQANDGFPALG